MFTPPTPQPPNPPTPHPQPPTPMHMLCVEDALKSALANSAAQIDTNSRVTVVAIGLFVVVVALAIFFAVVMGR